MTHLGTPSAGWYADPSGAHRARYWDGAAWTEQVRDDLLDDSSGAAATVAGVAQAVAAVAAADPRPVTSEAVPTAPASWSPVAASVAEWAPGQADLPPMTPAPTAFDGPSAFDVSTAFDDPTAVPAPFPPAVEPEAALSGPVAGWYPDPASRHQARYWDGVRWTERVADHGLESADPIPEVTMVGAVTSAAPGAVPDGVGMATLLDPEHGAWTAELLGAVNADGSPVSAGQASLAKLPTPDDVPSDTKRTQARPSAKVRIAGGMVLGGGVALLVGSALDWMKVSGPRVGDSWTRTGVELGDGRVTIVLAIVLAVLGAAIMTGRLSRFGGSRVAAMGALVAGAAAAAVTAVDITDVANRATRLGVPSGAVTDVGIGLWLCFMGALVALGGGLMAFAHRADR